MFHKEGGLKYASFSKIFGAGAAHLPLSAIRSFRSSAPSARAAPNNVQNSAPFNLQNHTRYIFVSATAHHRQLSNTVRKLLTGF